MVSLHDYEVWLIVGLVIAAANWAALRHYRPRYKIDYRQEIFDALFGFVFPLSFGILKLYFFISDLKTGISFWMRRRCGK